MTIPKWKPDPLPERRGRQLTDGRIINLWMQGSYTQNAVMTISVSHLFLDTMDYALGTLMLAAVADTLGTAKVEPRGWARTLKSPGRWMTRVYTTTHRAASMTSSRHVPSTHP